MDEINLNNDNVAVELNRNQAMYNYQTSQDISYMISIDLAWGLISRKELDSLIDNIEIAGCYLLSNESQPFKIIQILSDITKGILRNDGFGSFFAIVPMDIFNLISESNGFEFINKGSTISMNNDCIYKLGTLSKRWSVFLNADPQCHTIYVGVNRDLTKTKAFEVILS